MRPGLAILFILLLAGQTAAKPCGDFSFPPIDDRLRETMSWSLAKIYTSAEGGRYVGTGTLVDVRRGLIITAAHVLAGVEQAYVEFPETRDGVRHPTTVVGLAEPADGAAESAGQTWGQVRDVAILQTDVPVPILRNTDVWLEEFNLNDKLHFFSFRGDSLTPVPGEAVASIPSPGAAAAAQPNCTYELREATEPGDSGSPVVDGAGVLVGLVTASFNKGRAGRFVAATCLGDLLFDVLGQSVAEQVLTDVSTAPMAEVIRRLQPAQHYNTISNIELATMLRLAASAPEKAHLLAERHNCPIRSAVIQRGIGLDLYDRYVRSLPAETAGLREEGDSFFEEALLFEAGGRSQVAAVLFRAAETRYGRALLEEPVLTAMADGASVTPSDAFRATAEKLVEARRKARPGEEDIADLARIEPVIERLSAGSVSRDDYEAVVGLALDSSGQKPPLRPDDAFPSRFVFSPEPWCSSGACVAGNPVPAFDEFEAYHDMQLRVNDQRPAFDLWDLQRAGQPLGPTPLSPAFPGGPAIGSFGGAVGG